MRNGQKGKVESQVTTKAAWPRFRTRSHIREQPRPPFPRRRCRARTCPPPSSLRALERPPRGQRQVPVEEQRGDAEAEQQEAKQRILTANLAPHVQPLLQPPADRPHPRPHLSPRSGGRAALRGRGRGRGHPQAPAAEPHSHPPPSFTARRSRTRPRPATLAARAQPAPTTRKAAATIHGRTGECSD